MPKVNRNRPVNTNTNTDTNTSKAKETKKSSAAERFFGDGFHGSSKKSKSSGKEEKVEFATARMSDTWEYLYNKGRPYFNAASKVGGYFNTSKYAFWRSGKAPKRNNAKTADAFIEQAMSQRGVTYELGGKARSTNQEKLKTVDCSGLVKWAAARSGLSIPDGSMRQKAAVKKMSVRDAIRTKGALLFYDDPRHVAISLGDGRVIESRAPWGVTVGRASFRGWTSAGTIRGMKE